MLPLALTFLINRWPSGYLCSADLDIPAEIQLLPNPIYWSSLCQDQTWELLLTLDSDDAQPSAAESEAGEITLVLAAEALQARRGLLQPRAAEVRAKRHHPTLHRPLPCHLHLVTSTLQSSWLQRPWAGRGGQERTRSVRAGTTASRGPRAAPPCASLHHALVPARAAVTLSQYYMV